MLPLRRKIAKVHGPHLPDAMLTSMHVRVGRSRTQSSVQGARRFVKTPAPTPLTSLVRRFLLLVSFSQRFATYKALTWQSSQDGLDGRRAGESRRWRPAFQRTRQCRSSGSCWRSCNTKCYLKIQAIAWSTRFLPLILCPPICVPGILDVLACLCVGLAIRGIEGASSECAEPSHSRSSTLLFSSQVFDQHCASVAELGGPDGALLSAQPLQMRSSLILSAAPSRESAASWAEYATWAKLDEHTVAHHAKQRDAEHAPGGGELYKLIRQIEVDVDKLFYEVHDSCCMPQLIGHVIESHLAG